MLWLCQITFAGVGGLTAAELATNHGWPVLAAILVGGLVALPIGLLVGFLTHPAGRPLRRPGDADLRAARREPGLHLPIFVEQRPRREREPTELRQLATSPSPTSASAVFVVVALFIVNLRRSTTGLALNAVRWSEPGAGTLGISVVQMKIIVAGLAAFVAGIGGGLLVMAQTTCPAGNFATFLGVVWLAVLVTIGIRSTAAALVAGLSS